ncbi:CehA/McbA family metallohydrolase [Mucilaginibacter galii]|uniref:Phosphoesterase n=1 Tax=Mucilaginibacter galii TaxID=2005073 RepID=A0A917JD75_9SPHI|nr:CehA/McbA family metallohydrolase [Mucilaginibacter galii]GGI51926.1 phosphoesterase [Mucilaginibacter galii]
MKFSYITSFILLILNCFSALGQKADTVLKSGHIDSTQIFKLFYVPVNVPAGITEIKVKEQYSNEGKNVLNMGIYAPGDYSIGKTVNFRGWSGGAKNEFFINEADASTGYIPGKITPGIWHVLIYSSTIIKAGLDWKLEISLSKTQPKKPFIIKPAKKIINQITGWYSGDLHMHTLHSDGKRTQQELVDEAVSKKLDYIISTEHNTNSANLKWGYYDPNNLLVINGEEITTTAFGHWNALGLKTKTLIDWRYTPTDKVIQRYINMVHNDGGLCIINHPFYTKDLSNGFKFDPLLFDGIEIWNGNWDFMDAKALKWWQQLLKQGNHLLAIGASDTHKATGSENNLGNPSTIVYAEGLSKEAILNGLRNRTTYISSLGKIDLIFNAQTSNGKATIGETLKVKPAGEVSANLVLKPLPNAVVTLIGEQGPLFTVKADREQYQWTIPAASTKFIRIEVRDAKDQMLILTNPIWLK